MATKRRPNFLIVLIDDLRFDELGICGHPYMKTPNIHRLPNYHVVLQKLGYETAHVGKWHMGNSGGPRPGYHRWVSFPGHGSIMNPVLNIDGDERQHQGYITDLLNAHAVDFLRKERSQPFALFFAHKA